MLQNLHRVTDLLRLGHPDAKTRSITSKFRHFFGISWPLIAAGFQPTDFRVSNDIDLLVVQIAILLPNLQWPAAGCYSAGQVANKLQYET
ncbi:hypothetical protein CVT25_003277 [Psilocybe cyanescens]|uniref:Uncharacterized protein n=1 Tax=Psilocybe cyanescens TaxID=93625 RepID=A0A409WM98_PSICY|nr:hypothetical protein CVT25_003277 [Psilocybe cyanescens]